MDLLAKKQGTGPAKHFAVVFDLDGILATRDIAHDFFEQNRHGKEFRKQSAIIADAVNHGSVFDGGPAYAGQTVEFVLNRVTQKGVPLLVSDLVRIAENSRIMPGAVSIMKRLRRNPNTHIFIVSASYKPAADVIGRKVGIPSEHIFATRLQVEGDRIVGTQGPAMGGIYKAGAIQRIQQQTQIPLERFACVGDSITDIEMVEKIAQGGGLSIAFNANPDLLSRKPSVVVAANSLKKVGTLLNAFIANGHPGVQRLVRKNAFLRRFIFSRPFIRTRLFSGNATNPKEIKRAAAASAKSRNKTRTPRYARLR